MLPIEIWLIVAEHVTGVTDLAMLCSTSRSLHSAAGRLLTIWMRKQAPGIRIRISKTQEIPLIHKWYQCEYCISTLHL